MLLLFASTITAVEHATPKQQPSIRVSMSGDDRNSGLSPHEAVRTLRAALERVRERRRLASSEVSHRSQLHYTIQFEAGTYEFGEPVVLTADDSNITISGDRGRATFSGGRRVSAWRSVAKTDPGYQLLSPDARASVMVASIDSLPVGMSCQRTAMALFDLSSAANGTRVVTTQRGANIVFGLASPRANASRVRYVGQFLALSACQEAARAIPNAVAYAYHESAFPDEQWREGCYVRVDRHGDLTPHVGEGEEDIAITSGRIGPSLAVGSWLPRARFIIGSGSVVTRHARGAGTEDEMWFPMAEKQILQLSAPCDAFFPRGSAAPNATYLRVYQTDFNMGVLPISSAVATSTGGCNITTAVAPIYKMGRTPGYCEHGSADHFCYPAQFLDNAIAALTAPGDWALDPHAQLVYYWPSREDAFGKPLLDHVILSTNSELVRVEGDAERPAEGITFEGIRFAFGALAMPSDDDHGGVQHDYAQVDKANALLRLRSTARITVRDCVFEYSDGVGLRADLDARGHTIANSTFRFLGLEALTVAGYGAGRKDASGNNSILHNHIHHIGQTKDDAPAVVLWHTAFNVVAHNYIHDTPSKGVYLGGARDRAFTPETPMRGQAWKMARWDEIPSNITEAVVDPTRGDQGIDPPNTPDDHFFADHKCAPYRYTRGNLVANNTFQRIHAWMDRKFFADGVIYISGTADGAPNQVRNNLFVEIGAPGTGAPINELIYTDGYGGFVEIRGNVAIGAQSATLQLSTWYGHSSVEANVWYSCIDAAALAGADLWTIGGNLILNSSTTRALASDRPCADAKAQPMTQVPRCSVLDASKLHAPNASYLADYSQSYGILCRPQRPSPPVKQLPGLAEFLIAFGREINALGGHTLPC